MATAKVKTKLNKKSKIKQKYPIVRIFLRAEFNNTIVTLTDLEGKVIAWSSAGKVGFKGAKKSTPFAAQRATEEILEKVKAVEASSLQLVIWGAGQGRDPFLRTIQATDLQIDSIQDVTGFPHGGVKSKNKRRV
jgi:small subunit ribosomal protein S11